jgi:ABC-type multidrug transport system fused ATPase/permease subunit
VKKIKDFLPFLKPYKKKIYLTLFSILIANLLGLAFPWAIKVIIDGVLVRKDILKLNILAVALVFVFTARFYFGFMREYLISLIGENVVCDLRNKLYWHLQKLSVSYVDNTAKGEIISGVIGDVESVRKFLFGGAVDFIYAFFNVFFVLLILFVLDWKLTLIFLFYLPAFGLVFLKFSPRLKEKYGFLRAKYADLTARLNEVFNGMRIVAGFAKEEDEARKFKFQQQEILRASLASEKLGIFLWMFAEFISSLGLVALIWFGAQAVFAGRITIGTLMAFYVYLGMLFSPVIKMAIINNYYQEARACLERINKVFAAEPKIEEAARPVALEKLRGNVRFADVSFGYTADKEVLSGINLKVKESEVVALVGKSGAGKTTLVNLLLRFYEPTKGAIFIDGYNLKDLELKSYRSKIAMVLQDDYLFSGSIRENILYAMPGASEAELIRAAEMANAHSFIVELPSGYDTQIGERGIKLSFGQRQRISIARAILRNPAILILDEATSNVDSQTERLIIEQAFKKLMRGRTTFVIAHRLSAISYADKIVVIEDGRISETGSHYELLNKKGSYWKLWLEQTKGNAEAIRDYAIEPGR